MGVYIACCKLRGIYFYTPSAQIYICYSEVAETAKVNLFAQIHPKDIDVLRQVGKLVCKQTIATANREVIRIILSLIGKGAEPTIVKQPEPNLPTDGKFWREVQADIKKAIKRNSLEEPDNIRLIRLGVIRSGAGTGGSSYPLLVHQKAYLIIDGGGIFFRILQMSTEKNVSLDILKNIKKIFAETFDHVVFFGDLGLETLEKFGSLYMAALETVVTRDEFRQLTALLLLLFNVFYCWINLTFPWQYGEQFTHQILADVADEPKLPTYRRDIDST